MSTERTIDGLEPMQRELRFALPYWAPIGVLVNEPDDKPEFEGRPVRRIVLTSARSELTSAHVGARIERFRSKGVQYLVVPARVYPWLERHPDLPKFLRTMFRRIDVDEAACQVYALRSEAGDEPAIAVDGLPDPPPEMVAIVAGWIQPEEFHQLGKYGATWIAEMLVRNGIQPRELGTVLDFGCGCGRVIRHWPQFTDAALHGSDYNPHLLGWCKENLPFADFRLNELQPPLPFDDDYFDFVYALSIFTHLDAELHIAWMEELKRVVKPAGLLLPTFHGRSRLEYMRTEGQYERIAPGFEAGELVVIASERAGSSECAAYHPERYIREVLAEGLEIVDFSPGGALDIQQDAVLFRKPG